MRVLEGALAGQGVPRDAAEAARFDALAVELDAVGWTLALLSAAAEGAPELARHHPDGLRILLAWRFQGELSGGSSGVPKLTPAGGPSLAWRVARRAFDAGCLPRFELRAGGWRIDFGAGPPLEVPRTSLHD